MSNWEEIIVKKIAEAKQKRGARKRNWIKIDESFATSSINYRMELSEIGVFVKLLLFAAKFGPVPGLISDNDFRPMPHEYLAHQACCPLELFESTLKKGINDDSIYENSHGIFLTHFDDYQFTEYDRQKPWRDEQKAKKVREDDPGNVKRQSKWAAIATTQEDLDRIAEIREAAKAKAAKTNE